MSSRLHAYLLLLLLPSISAPAFAQDVPTKGWVDFNFLALKSQQDSQTVTFTTTVFSETASSAAAYPRIEGTGQAFEFGGGFRFVPLFGMGVHFDAANIDQVVGLGATIPHPLLFGRAATGIGITDLLKRQDRSVDIQAIYFIPTPDAWMVRVFAGPSYFMMKEDRVGIINYNQAFNAFGANVITLTPPTTQEVDGTGWGVNAGADVGFFFSRNVGVGGTVRFNKGTVTLEDPLSGIDVDRQAGHTNFGGGLRLRF
jgi:hypothetical protein